MFIFKKKEKRFFEKEISKEKGEGKIFLLLFP
jgi:hypothetical protein